MAGPPPTSSYASYPSLSADQQKLLLAALTSNDRSLNVEEFRNSAGSENMQPQEQGSTSSDDGGTLQAQSEGIDPSVFNANPRRPQFGDGLLPVANGHSDFDVDIDFSKTEFDADDDLANFDSLFEGEFGEKRKSPEDDEDDEEGDSKRREGDEKQPKKPGRKPLTSEPTTKRKAQNRAAQRAFRERKEKHLKDLEIKVSSLEEESASTNHENKVLKAQISQLQTELQDYKKRLSLAGSALNGSSPTLETTSYQPRNRASSGPYDFQFDFPVFGDLFPSTGSSSSPSNVFNNANGNDFTGVKPEPTSRTGSTSTSPQHNSDYTNNSPSYGSSFTPRHSQSNGLSRNSASPFAADFFNLGDGSYGFPTFGSPKPLHQSISPPAQHTNQSNSNITQSTTASSVSQVASPSSSSVSHNGPTSSCGTSPEPTNGYGNGEMSTTPPNQQKQSGQANGTSSFQQSQTQQSQLDLSTFQFDPMLFGGYRETQDAILGDGDFSGGLYDDYLNLPGLDSTFNYNNNFSKNTPLTQATPKPTLMAQVDKLQEEGNDNSIYISDKLEEQNMMTCHKIWEQLSECPKFKEGELDIDGLCSELSKKATCSERGAVIPKAEWEAALWRLVGQENPENGAPQPVSDSKN